jgi:hypothetical protein
VTDDAAHGTSRDVYNSSGSMFSSGKSNQFSTAGHSNRPVVDPVAAAFVPVWASMRSAVLAMRGD